MKNYRSSNSRLGVKSKSYVKSLSAFMNALVLATSAVLLVACGGTQQEADVVKNKSVSLTTAKTEKQSVGQVPKYNFAEALQKSILFYEAQQSGKLPDWNRVNWRGDSRLNDGAEVGVDLTGGWYDAGDHVKFGFPMAWSATELAWGVLEFEAGYKNAQQYDAMLRNLRFVNDYLIKAHAKPNELWGQVGKGSTDHSWWGPVEVYPLEAPAYKIDASCGGSDLAGETAAAMASASMVFKSSDPAYSATLLSHARQLFSFADTVRKKYSDCITDAAGYYNSWSGYNDELAWSAAWLYRATGEQVYLDKAEALVNTSASGFGTEGQSNYLPYKWTHDWDSKHYGSYILLAKITGKQKYIDAIERNLAYWTTGTPEGERVQYTPGGLAWLSQWGSLRYSMNESFVALVYAKQVADAAKKKIYVDFAMGQLNYLLGDNPRKGSYLIGFGTNSPQHPHHRTSHGSWADSQTVPLNHRHMLYGALVGGPGVNDTYTDSISDYVSNEVATDYSAAVTGVLAAAQEIYPGSLPLAGFPQKELPTDDEMFVEAGINSSGTTYTEIKALVNNRSGWPARLANKLSFRYFVDLSEVTAAGKDPSVIKVTSNFGQGGATAKGLFRCGVSSIYYAVGDFTGVQIYPGGQSAYRKELQVRIAAPDSTNYWNPNNDPSYQNLSASNVVRTNAIALYDNGKLVYGKEPAACGGVVILPPAPPQQLSASPAAGKISLAWATVTGATSYTVKRSGSGIAGSFSLLANTLNNAYVDLGLPGNTSYYYLVNANNDGGSSNDSSIVSATTPISPPAAPIATATGSNAKVVIAWQLAAGATSYEVSRATTAGGTFVSVASNLIGSSYTDNAVTNGLTYYYKVTANNAVGATASEVVSATPAAADNNCTLTLDTSNDWGAGQVMQISLANKGTTNMSNWTISFVESNDFTLGNSWNGNFSLAARKITITPQAWNGTIAPGQSISAGMQIAYSAGRPVPSMATVTGLTCTVVIK